MSADIKPHLDRITAIIGDEVEAILQRLHAVEKDAHERITAVGPPVEFDYDGAAEYLHISRRSLERVVDARAIGFRRAGKRVFFTKAALDEYMQTGRVIARPVKPLTL